MTDVVVPQPQGAQGSALRLRQLAAVMAELAAAESMDTIVDVVVHHIADAMGAAVATLMLRDDDRLLLVAAHGVRPGVQEEFASFGVGDLNPASEAVRTGRPVVLSAADDIGARYPVLAGHMPQDRSLMCLPLSAAGASLGVVGLTFDHNWTPDQEELAFLTAFADGCAQAVRRARATDELEERLRQLRFLADASIELASSLDYHATLSNVATLLVPELAEWCAVAMTGENGLTTVAVAHADPARVEWAWKLEARYPPDPDASTGAPNVARTGVSELYEKVTDDMLVAAARDEEHLRLSRELDIGSALTVPLTARGQVLGVITLLRTTRARPYDHADLVFAEDLGRRAGQAVDNARLHRQAQDVALQLQQAVLPDDLSGLPSWEIAAYYTPDGNAEVGGDFYDAVELDDGVLAVFIGDVMGHGVAAAAAMAHVRAAARAYLTGDPDPASVMTRLDRMFARLGITRLVTLCYAVIDPARGDLTLVSAGHYPPLIIASDGTTRFAAADPQPPLGVGGERRVESRFRMDASDTLLLYTDGVIERRGEIIDRGLERLALESPPLCTGGDLQATLSRVVAGMCSDTADDVTALVVRRRRSTA